MERGRWRRKGGEKEKGNNERYNDRLRCDKSVREKGDGEGQRSGIGGGRRERDGGGRKERERECE